MRTLLILSCSARKRPGAGLLPAIERYDGPVFHVLRRFLRTVRAEALDVYILSAQFGLIPSDHLIPIYDQRMTPVRAQELKPHVLRALQDILSMNRYREIYLAMGRDYLPAFEGHDAIVPPEIAVTIGTGTQGKRLASLHDWLYGTPPAPRHVGPKEASRQGPHIPRRPRVRGIEVALTAEQALDLGRQALARDPGEAGRYQSWYAPIDGTWVAPKWLVSQLTGLPVRAFTTDEARRLLGRLGIAVRRVPGDVQHDISFRDA